MANRVSAHIQIGGILSRSRYPELISAIADDDPAIDWDGTPFDPSDLPATGPLCLMDHEVADGRFDEIEQCCRSLGLSYVRWRAGYSGSFPSDREICFACGEPETFLTTEEDTLIFTIERIRELGSMEAIEAEYARANSTPPPLTIIDDDPVDCAAVETIHG
jgi:hypothetical protein